ncbi:hypothetical protein KJK34_01275 [Flavobacterium sp. D11R37]|uniref:hypothetical protein n=1 Tax=Flavobacterium coralii TaxID=2838017 RepID=UPI001CA7235C|nr:hypothetical protein [Flavobacterium coralii]MBY8961373.1 hypothetical protein [Flavobacterium coralii]
MELQYIVIASAFAVVVGMLLYLIKIQKTKQQVTGISNSVELRAFELEMRNISDKEKAQLRLNYENIISRNKLEFEKQLNHIKEDCRLQRQNEYDKGYAMGLKASNITVQIIPYKEVAKDDGIFFKEDVVIVGYKYQLLCNGIPCLQSHLEITERIYVKDLKDETIRTIVKTLETVIQMIPNSNMKMVGSFNDLGKELLSMKKN